MDAWWLAVVKPWFSRRRSLTRSALEGRVRQAFSRELRDISERAWQTGLGGDADVAFVSTRALAFSSRGYSNGIIL